MWTEADKGLLGRKRQMMRAIYNEPKVLLESIRDMKNRLNLLDTYGFSPMDINLMFINNPGTDFNKNFVQIILKTPQF